MKPDWKDAPGWAKWLAQDGEGTWFWYEKRPYLRGINVLEWDNPLEGKAQCASKDPDEWRDSLEPRP